MKQSIYELNYSFFLRKLDAFLFLLTKNTLQNRKAEEKYFQWSLIWCDLFHDPVVVVWRLNLRNLSFN